MSTIEKAVNNLNPEGSRPGGNKKRSDQNVSSENTIEITKLGELFIRNVCSLFDARLKVSTHSKPIFSSSI